MSTSSFDLLTAPLDQGTVLLEASAGTGKTYTLTGIVLRLLLEGGIERLDQALVVTFTIAATDELKNRLRRAIGQALAVCEGAEPPGDAFFASLARHGKKGAKVLRQALDDFDQVAISTIHGFCKRVLDEAAFESHEPFQLEFAVDEGPLWQRAAEDAVRLLRRDDPLTLGVLLHDIGIDPDWVVRRYRLWQRYPGVQLAPAAPALRAHLDALREAVHGAAPLFDASARQGIAEWLWKKDKQPLPDLGEPTLDRFAATLRTQPELVLGTLAALAPEQLRKAIHKDAMPALDHPFLLACGRVAAARAKAEAHLTSDLLLRMHERLALHKRQDRVVSFQDLLSRTHAALHDPGRRQGLLQSLRQRFQVALIDEFQDTDSLQYGIFATSFQHRPLFLVGDPKQSIYGFRGADLRTYLAASKDAIQRTTLDQNHRSCAQLVAAVDQLFRRPSTFVTEGIDLPSVRAKAGPDDLQVTGDPGASLRWRFVPPAHGKSPWLTAEFAEQRIAADVTAEISRLLRHGIRLDDAPLRPGHIAVLTRTNRQAITVQDSLRAAGIVSAIGKAGDVFETEELVEVERLLLAILQPTDLRRARAAMATRLWGHTAASLQALDVDETAFERERAMLEDWRQSWLRQGFVVMKEQVLLDRRTEARILALRGGERRLTNYHQLFEMLHQAEHEHRLSPEGVLQWLQHERRHKDEIDYQRRELRLESDEDAVQILTVHGSKGLQYEIVFCPFLWHVRPARGDIVLMDRADGRRLEFGVPSDDPDFGACEAERLAEDVRLCYVALTRAKRRCYVHWGALGHNGACAASALGWLLLPQLPDTKKRGWPREWPKASKADVPAWGDHLQALAVASGGTMSVEAVADAPTAVPLRPVAQAPRRPVRTATRKPRPLALHSFTSLAADAAPIETAPDVQDPAVAPPAAGARQPAGRGIFGFQRGAEAGQCLHALLEHVDLGALHEPLAAALVRATLQQYGLLAPLAHPGTVDPVADVLATLRALAGALTHADGPTIGDLCRGRKVAEWQFTLPLHDADVRGLAAVLGDHGGDVARRYAPRLATLPQRTLRGFLGGFADLVAEHDGRFWLLDWKSNHLGDDPGDYAPTAVDAAMHDHDYVLQYHLYGLALHRHLRARLRTYDPARHFGGVCYAFLRGAIAGAANGMFFDRPGAALLDAMDRWAAGRGGRG